MKTFFILTLLLSVSLIYSNAFNFGDIGKDINNVIHQAGNGINNVINQGKNDVNNVVNNYNSHTNITNVTVPTVTPPPTPAQEQNALIAAIQGQLGNKDPIQNEASTSSLVNNIKSIGVSHFIQCTTSQLTSELAPFNLPADVVAKINSIVYMQSTAFQGFILIIQGATGTLTQVAGAARNVQGTVQLAFVNAVTTGVLVQQYATQSYVSQDCHFCTDISKGFKCCNNNVHYINVPTGLTSTQIQEISGALQTAGESYIQSQLDNPPAQFKNYANLEGSAAALTMFSAQAEDVLGYIENMFQNYKLRR